MAGKNRLITFTIVSSLSVVRLSATAFSKLGIAYVVRSFHALHEQETPFLLGKDYALLESALYEPLVIRSFSVGADYALNWTDETPTNEPNPLARLIDLNRKLQVVLKRK